LLYGLGFDDREGRYPQVFDSLMLLSGLDPLNVLENHSSLLQQCNRYRHYAFASA
jgi:hypothetical protein